jgi:hypothetical protein
MAAARRRALLVGWTPSVTLVSALRFLRAAVVESDAEDGTRANPRAPPTLFAERDPPGETSSPPGSRLQGAFMLGRTKVSSSLFALASLAALASCTTDSGATQDSASESATASAGALPLLSAAAIAAFSATSSAKPGAEAALAARPPRPPIDPLLKLAQGRWLGTCDILLTGQTEPAITIEIERITEPTATPGELTWTLIYRSAGVEQVRPYTMRVDTTAPGRYTLDENNGVLITNRLQGGNLLYSDFEVQGIRLRTRELFKRNRYDFEIGVSATTPELSTDAGGTIVDSYRVLNTQKCTMRRIGDGGHSPGAAAQDAVE